MALNLDSDKAWFLRFYIGVCGFGNVCTKVLNSSIFGTKS